MTYTSVTASLCDVDNLMHIDVVQDVLQPCAALVQAGFFAAMLAEHRAAKKELLVWVESRDDLEPLLPFQQGTADV